MKLLSTQKLLTLLFVLPISMIGIHSNAQAQLSPTNELAEMDAAATMLGSIRSWVNSDPEAAIAAFENYERVRQYVDQKHAQYAGSNGRSADRAKAIESGIKAWEEFLTKYHAKQPKQIATELKRQRKAVLRYKKSKSPRPSSFAYIPKTVWQTKDRLDVLTASGADTKELQAEQGEVQTMVLELLATLDDETIAKKNSFVRDAYKQADRSAIETVATQQWSTTNPDQAITRIVMPKSSWSHTYSARFDESSSRVVPEEIDRMTVYVATRKSDGILTLNPIRLMRENQMVNGKTGPQSASVIPTNEFPFDVLEKNIR
jgi:hypothetical protein